MQRRVRQEQLKQPRARPVLKRQMPIRQRCCWLALRQQEGIRTIACLRAPTCPRRSASLQPKLSSPINRRRSSQRERDKRSESSYGREGRRRLHFCVDWSVGCCKHLQILGSQLTPLGSDHGIASLFSHWCSVCRANVRTYTASRSPTITLASKQASFVLDKEAAAALVTLALLVGPLAATQSSRQVTRASVVKRIRGVPYRKSGPELAVGFTPNVWLTAAAGRGSSLGLADFRVATRPCLFGTKLAWRWMSDCERETRACC